MTRPNDPITTSQEVVDIDGIKERLQALAERNPTMALAIDFVLDDLEFLGDDAVRMLTTFHDMWRKTPKVAMFLSLVSCSNGEADHQ